MEELGTIWRISVAGLAVCRLSSLLVDGPLRRGSTRLVRTRPENFLGSRIMDCLYWLHVWLSAQTALWVAYGFAAVVLSWLIVLGVSHAAALHSRVVTEQPTEPRDASRLELPCCSREAAR